MDNLNISARRNPDRNVFFAQELKEIYREEKHILREIKKTAEDSPVQKLKEAFKDYEEITWHQMCKISDLFNSLGEAPEKNQSKTIENITKEIEQGILEITYNPFTKCDVIARCERIYHYKMMLYNNSVQASKTITSAPSPVIGSEKETEKKRFQGLKQPQ